MSGLYDLCITSDDGSRLYLDYELIIDNDGLHTDVVKCASKILSGVHNIVVEYFESGGLAVMVLEWKTPGSSLRSIIPHSVWVT